MNQNYPETPINFGPLKCSLLSLNLFNIFDTLVRKNEFEKCSFISLFECSCLFECPSITQFLSVLILSSYWLGMNKTMQNIEYEEQFRKSLAWFGRMVYIPSECLAVRINIRSDKNVWPDPGPNCCKDYQQMAIAGKKLLYQANRCTLS